ncbi:MAG TPA: 2-oxoacid:acceptor oxidoreductase family protein [Syntrophales bacterium]|nr:2-oxoacid:acceptor oxidoreductase family protein [Syntrophales bacterium]
MASAMTDKERHILMTGFGGQGVIMAGDILGTAATIYDGKFATMTQAYGPEARGGACSAQIIIGNREVLFPYIEEPDVLICMSQEGYAKNIGNLGEGGILIFETDLVQIKDATSGVTTYNIPATRFAEELGNKMMANIVMLGFLAAVSDLVSVDALRKAVLTAVPAPTRENNSRAFERGREYGKTALKSRAKQGRLARD